MNPRPCPICGLPIVSPRSRRCATCGAAASRVNFMGRCERTAPSSTADIIRAAASVASSDGNGTEKEKAVSILSMAGPVVLRHVGGVGWDDLMEDERTTIKRTLALLRPALQDAGLLPPDPRPEDLDLSPEGDGDRAL
jgi:hypothetical protein